MTIDNIISNQRRNHAPGDFLLAPSLGIHVFVPKHIYQVQWARCEDVPSSGKPDLDGTVFFERFAQPAVIDSVLAHVAPETEEGYVDWHGWDVPGHGRWDQGVPV